MAILEGVEPSQPSFVDSAPNPSAGPWLAPPAGFEPARRGLERQALSDSGGMETRVRIELTRRGFAGRYAHQSCASWIRCSRRELNPRFLIGNEACHHNTSTALVRVAGIEPA